MIRRRAFAGSLLLALCAGAAAVHLAMAARPVVRTVALTASPWAVAIDPATDHAFVLTRPVNRTRRFSGVADGTGSVSVVDLATGTVVRAVSPGLMPRDIAVDPGTGQAFVVGDGAVSVLDTRSDAVVQMVTVAGQPRAVALDTQSHRAWLIDGLDDTISVIDTRRAAVVRTLPAEGGSDALSSSQAPADSAYNPSAWSAPGWSPAVQGYVGDFGRYFRWGAVVDGRTQRVFVGGPGTVRVLDARSGTLLRTVGIAGNATHLAVDIQAGRVYVAGDDGVSVLGARTGQVLYTLAVGGPASAVAVDAARGRLYVAHAGAMAERGMRSGAGTLSVLDAPTGATLRTLPVGVDPVAVAVDGQTGQVIVLNAGGRVQTHSAWTWVPASLQRWVPFQAGQAAGPRWVAGSISVLAAGS